MLHAQYGSVVVGIMAFIFLLLFFFFIVVFTSLDYVRCPFTDSERTEERIRFTVTRAARVSSDFLSLYQFTTFLR